MEPFLISNDFLSLKRWDVFPVNAPVLTIKMRSGLLLQNDANTNVV